MNHPILYHEVPINTPQDTVRGIIVASQFVSNVYKLSRQSSFQRSWKSANICRLLELDIQKRNNPIYISHNGVNLFSMFGIVCSHHFTSEQVLLQYRLSIDRYDNTYHLPLEYWNQDMLIGIQYYFQILLQHTDCVLPTIYLITENSTSVLDLPSRELIFATLPDDILEKVLSYCPGTSIHVSRRFYHLAFNHILPRRYRSLLMSLIHQCNVNAISGILRHGILVSPDMVILAIELNYEAIAALLYRSVQDKEEILGIQCQNTELYNRITKQES